MAHLMNRIAVESLTLTAFRNYASLTLEPEGKSVILTGPNGSGKTNLLEAVSLLMPGRGLRQVKLAQLKSQTAEMQAGWGVAITLKTGKGEQIAFGTGQQSEREDKRIVRIDGEPIKSQSSLSQHFPVLWQTPQMDGLFAQGASEQRRYYDRLCASFVPDHTAQVAKYDYLRRERAKLLSFSRPDEGWLGSLERKMAECSLSIAATRLELLDALNYAMEGLHEAFPKAALSLKGFAEKALNEQTIPAIEIEEQLCQALALSRREDAKSGRASHGAHKTELKVMFVPKAMEAGLCSTGEQKALMLSLLLAQTQAMKQRQNRLPILLLDEVVAHLDEHRRQALFTTLQELGPQCWMTGTDALLFQGFEPAIHYELSAGPSVVESKKESTSLAAS